MSSLLTRGLRSGNDESRRIVKAVGGGPSRNKQIKAACRDGEPELFRTLAKEAYDTSLSDLLYWFVTILAVKAGRLPQDALPPQSDLPPVLQRLWKAEL